MPKEGTAKDPATPPERRAPQRLKDAGSKVGIDFTGKTDRYPNSTLMHALMLYTLENDGPAVQHTLADVTFRHYFSDGKYANAANLRDAAVEAGVAKPDAAILYAQDTANQARVVAEAADYSRKGVSGVPFFVVNGTPAGSGAMPPSTFKSLIEEQLLVKT